LGPKADISSDHGAGDISAVAPFRYTALLWPMLLGYLAFGDRLHAVRRGDHRAVRPLYLYRERVRRRVLAANASGSPPDGA
jgi:hypothetical protein